MFANVLYTSMELKCTLIAGGSREYGKVHTAHARIVRLCHAPLYSGCLAINCHVCSFVLSTELRRHESPRISPVLQGRRLRASLQVQEGPARPLFRSREQIGGERDKGELWREAT